MGVMNIFTGGQQGNAQTGGGAGRSRNRPNRSRNRGGGGGGGHTKVPNTGLYAGKAGKAAANQDPARYFTALLGLSDAGTDYDRFLQETLVPNLVNEYTSANAGRQKLGVIKWLRQTYGAGYQGKKARTANLGQLSDDALADQYATWQANTNPRTYLLGQASGAGGALGAGGNSDFADWYTNSFAPRMEVEYRAAANATPGLNFADWLGTQDSDARARREFDTYRSNADPRMWAVQRAQASGLTPLNGNAQFEDWYANTYAPGLQRRFEAARTGNADLNFDAFEAGLDPREARRLYAYRAPQQRQPSAYTTGGGRWSWWS